MITPRTTGIIGVHLWGRPAPVSELQAVADENGLKLMFDAAHAFDCSYRGQLIGKFGSAEVLSFHATKFFNTFEGGAVVTDDDDMAGKMRLMRNFGFSGFDNVIHPGTNGKMTEVCAAMGLANFNHLKDVIEVNEANYQAYKLALHAIPGVELIAYDAATRNNFQYIVVEVTSESRSTRDEIVAALQAENVLARKYFWPGCHRMKPYRDLFPHAGMMLPHTEAVAGRVIVLPSGGDVGVADIEFIASVFRQLA